MMLLYYYLKPIYLLLIFKTFTANVHNTYTITYYLLPTTYCLLPYYAYYLRLLSTPTAYYLATTRQPTTYNHNLLLPPMCYVLPATAKL